VFDAGTSLASLFGLVGLTAACTWGLLKERRAIIAGQCVQCVSFGIHFGLIGAYTGSVLCALSLVQLVSASALSSRTARAAFWATAPAIALITLATWNGAASAAAAMGLALATAGRWQSDPLRLRWCFLGSSSGWAAHNLIVVSPFGLVTDVLTLCTNGWRIWRTYAARGPGQGEDMRGWMKRRVERQAELMGAMMERIGCDPSAASLRGRAYAAAGRRCLWCPFSQRCASWLEETGPASRAPAFCPNARFLEDARAAAS
jgi:hypothetical protein